jgi:hypothetical protein
MLTEYTGSIGVSWDVCPWCGGLAPAAIGPCLDCEPWQWFDLGITYASQEADAGEYVKDESAGTWFVGCSWNFWNDLDLSGSFHFERFVPADRWSLSSICFDDAMLTLNAFRVFMGD